MNDLKNMDLNLYKIFLEVAKTGSISKAAESLYVSQPAVSYSVKTLEEQLECKLFNRTAKGVELTANAQKLLFYVENAYNTLNAGSKMLKDTTGLISGEIRVGVPTHIGIFLLSKYIKKFSEKYPGIKFYIVNKSTNEMVEMLETRKLDLIVDSYPINSLRGDITLYELIEVDNCFVGNEKYREIAEKGTVKIENIQKYPLLLPPKGTSTRNALESKIKDKVSGLDASVDVATTEVMLDLVEKGMGIGYFSKESVQKYIKAGTLFKIPVNIDLPKTQICIAYVEDFLANAPKQFTDMIKSEIKQAKNIKEKALRMIVTQDCIYNCSMCHKEGLHSKKTNQLNADDISYIYEIVNKEFKIKKVDLTGGEPLIREDIEEILSKLKSKGAKITVTTNGYLLNEKMKICELIDKLNISIHSLEKEKFEKLCNKNNSFDRVMENIKKIRDKYPTLNIRINTTLIKGVNSTTSQIEDLIKMSNLLKVDIKLIELYPKQSENFVDINVIEPILKRLDFKFKKSTFRKKIYSNGIQEVILARCTCSIVSECKDKKELCKNNNDIYVTPDGKLSLCREVENEIDILEYVKNKNKTSLISSFENYLDLMGSNCK